MHPSHPFNFAPLHPSLTPPTTLSELFCFMLGGVGKRDTKNKKMRWNDDKCPAQQSQYKKTLGEI